MKKTILAGLVLATAVAVAEQEQVVDISAAGNRKFSVAVNVANPAFAKCLKRNLEISGVFQVVANGSVKVSGASGALRAEGNGKSVSSAETFADDKSARMAARKFSDAMVQAWGGQKGFACDKIVFLNRGKQAAKGQAVPGDLCTCYADGYDIRQLTDDGKMTVFPRWQADGNTLLYISDKKGAPQVWEMDVSTGKRSVKWSFKGSPTGLAVSPDGTKVAAILSVHGNPDLYVLQGGSFVRLTNTPNATEGQPTWSPDGKKIAYVSDETRHPQIYVIDVATKQKRRLTSRGSQNVDPDWGKDGRIAYITKRGGAQIAVMQPADGDASAQLVTQPASWQHPSWSRDMRHLTANRDKTLFVIDTLKDGDEPRPVFINSNGNWNSPCWIK